ncbi:MAG: hypothetical protein HUU08_01040 [Candidatus Brocadia sp.]|nr:hypothetical protein [Candidatus Brocadia sp.]
MWTETRYFFGCEQKNQAKGRCRIKKWRDSWKESLKWQRLKPYEKFAEMIERHWGGIAASYC